MIRTRNGGSREITLSLGHTLMFAINQDLNSYFKRGYIFNAFPSISTQGAFFIPFLTKTDEYQTWAHKKSHLTQNQVSILIKNIQWKIKINRKQLLPLEDVMTQSCLLISFWPGFSSLVSWDQTTQDLTQFIPSCFSFPDETWSILHLDFAEFLQQRRGRENRKAKGFNFLWMWGLCMCTLTISQSWNGRKGNRKTVGGEIRKVLKNVFLSSAKCLVWVPHTHCLSFSPVTQPESRLLPSGLYQTES